MKPRWTPDRQRAADDIRSAAWRACEAYNLSLDEVLVAMAMAAATIVPKPTENEQQETACGR